MIWPIVTFWCSLHTRQMMGCLHNLFYDSKHYFVCILANMEVLCKKFLNIFEDVYSLHMCFSADLSRLLHCITHANVWDIFWATRYVDVSKLHRLLLICSLFGSHIWNDFCSLLDVATRSNFSLMSIWPK